MYVTESVMRARLYLLTKLTSDSASKVNSEKTTGTTPKCDCWCFPFYFLPHSQSQVQVAVLFLCISPLPLLLLSHSDSFSFSHLSWKRAHGCLLDLVLYQIKLYSTCLPECCSLHGCTLTQSKCCHLLVPCRGERALRLSQQDAYGHSWLCRIVDYLGVFVGNPVLHFNIGAALLLVSLPEHKDVFLISTLCPCCR